MLVGDKLPAKKAALQIYIASMGRQAEKKAQEMVEQLRAQGICAEKDFMQRSLKSQMKYADKLGAENVLILGDEEINAGTAEIKNMQTGEQCRVSIKTTEQFVADYKAGVKKA